MATKVNARKRLRIFLTNHFTADGALRRFANDNFTHVTDEVAFDGSLAKQAESLIATLIDHNLIDGVWGALRFERDELSTDIADIEAQWRREQLHSVVQPGSTIVAHSAGGSPAVEWLPRRTLLDVHRAAVLVDLGPQRSALLLWVPTELIADVEQVPSPNAQLLIDLHRLNGAENSGAVENWLDNAIAIAPEGEDTIAFSDALTELANAAREAEETTRLDKEQMSALEGIILSVGRPAGIARGDTFATEGELTAWRSLLEDGRAFVERGLRATGKLKLRDHPRLNWVANAFVVSADLVCTTRHAVEAAVRDNDGMTSAMFVDFDDEMKTIGWPSTFDVEGEAFRHPVLDIALLRVPALASADIAPLPLAATRPEVGAPLARISFVTPDAHVDPDLQERIFKGIYDYKRVMPGRVVDATSAVSFAPEVPALEFDATTLGGVSGSPVVSLASGEVLGVGFARAYLKGNWAVPSWELVRDRRIRELGVVVGDGAQPPDDPWAQAWEQATLATAPKDRR